MLLMIALVIIACIIFNKFTSRFGMPALLAFIVLGMIFGSDGLFKIPFDDYSFAETFDDDSHIRLSESTIDAKHPWKDLMIRELPLNQGELIVMIRRNSETVIPNGNTTILEGDILVINRDDTQVAL